MDQRDDYMSLTSRLHRRILGRLDLKRLRKTSGNSAREEVLLLIRSAVNAEVVPLSFAERERLAREILDEIFGPPAWDETRQKKFGLIPRELEIVSAVVAGFSNREIGQYFKISEDTVKQQLNNIFAKLGVATRLQLALRSTGWLDSPEDGDAAGVAVKKPRRPNLNSGSAAASLDELFG
ncbi:MAG: LuxR C-terminal-related transcriptional regulator [Acidobacteriota bacterium]